MMGSGVLLMLGASLLVVAGLPKLLGRSGVPWLPRPAWRPAGFVEVAVGSWGLLLPQGGGAVGVAVTYAVLSGALLLAIVRSEPDCGCFGVEPVRPSWSHLALDVGLALIAAIAALSGWRVPGGIAGLTALGLSLVAASLLAELLSTGAQVRRLRVGLEEVR